MLPPGPSTPAFWQTLQFVRDPAGASARMFAKYGATIRFRALNGRGLATADPELARQIFATDPESFETPDTLAGIFGEHSVLATWGPTHKRQRKLLNPRFHSQEIRALASAMADVVREGEQAFARAAEEATIVVMSDWAQRLTLDIILSTVFGAAPIDRGEGRRVLGQTMKTMPPSAIFSRALRTPLYPPWKRYLKARAEFDAWLDRLLAAARASVGQGGARVDMLRMLIEVRDEDGKPMSDAEIRDLTFALLVAGHETTAVALSWAVHYLMREPAVLARLRAELPPLDQGPEALLRCAYLSALIKETLRIQPIVSDVSRVCREPVKVGPWTVPAGEFCSVNMTGLLKSSAVYENPERFEPERFLARNFHPGEYVPFGGGHRRCLGAAFAEAELAIAIAAIARNWNLAPADQGPERSVRRNITMGPARGVRVRVLGSRG